MMVNFLVNSEVDGYGAVFTFDGESWYFWDQSDSVCNVEFDYGDDGIVVNGLFVTNDEGTCFYDDFYSTYTANEEGDTVTGP